MRGRHFFVPLLAVAAAACRAPTEVVIEITHDLECLDMASPTEIRVGPRLEDLSYRSATTTINCTERRIGSLVVTPDSDDEGPVAFEVKASSKSVGTVIARRALRFIPHEKLAVPVHLAAECAVVPCDDPRTTCVKGGTCVPATIPDPGACRGVGCPESVLWPVADAGVDALADDTGAADAGAEIVRISSAVSSFSNGTIVVEIPAGVPYTPDHIVAGDFLFVVLYAGQGETVNAELADELGWTMTPRRAPTSCGGFFAWYGFHVVQPGDPTRYAFPFFSNGTVYETGYALLVYRGVDPDQPISFWSGGLEQGDYRLPQVNVGTPNSTLVAAYVDSFQDNGGTWFPPQGMTTNLASGPFGIFEAEHQNVGPSLTGRATTTRYGCATVFVGALKPK